MCSVGLAIGGIQAVGGIMQAQGQYNAQKAAVDRQNQIAKQQYDDQLRIQKQKSDAQKDKHDAELKAHAQAVNDFNKQLELNQIETNRAMSIVNQKKKEKATKVAFEQQSQVIKAIQASGKMLSTGNAGQSFLLQMGQHERELGMMQAQLEQSLFDSDKTAALESAGVVHQQYNRDASAYNNLPGMPGAPPAVLLPYKPIMASGPSKMALMGAMVGAVAGGAGAGLKAQANYDEITSDIRLKENIIKVGKALSGLNIYEWNYKSAPNSRYRGVMAQEVSMKFPEAVKLESDGFLSVIYDLIDVNMELIT